MVVELYTGPPPLRAALYIRMDSLVGVQEWRTLTKQAVLTFAIMISESLRIQSIQAAFVRLWQQGGTLTEKDAKYAGAWSALSQLYTTGDLKSLSENNRKKLSKIGVTTRAEAANIIDFV